MMLCTLFLVELEWLEESLKVNGFEFLWLERNTQSHCGGKDDNVNFFKQRKKTSLNSEILFTRLVVKPRLKKPVYPTVYPDLKQKVEVVDSYYYHGHLREVKYKELHLGLKLELPISFPTTIIIMLSSLPYIFANTKGMFFYLMLVVTGRAPQDCNSIFFFFFFFVLN